MGRFRYQPSVPYATVRFFEWIDYVNLERDPHWPMPSWGPRLDKDTWHPYFAHLDVTACPTWVIVLDYLRGMWLKAAHPFWWPTQLTSAYSRRQWTRWWMFGLCTQQGAVKRFLRTGEPR